jgi:hypothetical protein
MYFYHEHYLDAYAATLAELGSGKRRDDDLTYEPFRMPIIVNWLAVTGVALSMIVLSIHLLS